MSDSRRVIVVHPSFDGVWPFAADHFHELWQAEGLTEFTRLAPDDKRPVGEVVPSPETVTDLAALGVPLAAACFERMTALREFVSTTRLPDGSDEALKERGIRRIMHGSEGFWGQSVAEFGLALTLAALRRIPQTHHQILTDLSPWDYRPPDGTGTAGARGQQYGDDSDFTNGTLAGKRVRIVGAGNIASRYAAFCHFIGADVAAWDPFATEVAFHRTGARREHHLDRLVRDAEIFAPMVPLTDSPKGIVTAEQINALPKGCLVVLVTRAKICDTDALRRRVLANELSLAADVFDIEPLPLDDPLLGRRNVVHTPHNAGRTRDANRAWAKMLVDRFTPR
jgi:phosphoglycerate dehydrogenase-like enzyme